VSVRSYWEDPEQVEAFAAREPDLRLLELLAAYPDPGRTRVLDLGCAGGRNTVVLAERGFDFYAIDASNAMAERTRQRVAAVLGRAEARRRVRLGRMEDLSDFAAGWFDLVIALGVYHSASSRTEWDRAIAETVRVLAPGGRVLVASFTPASDPTGEGLRPVPGEPHAYEGFAAGRLFLLHADELDAAMARHGLVPAVPTETVTAPTGSGRRVTANGLYRVAGGGGRG
jgi:SAM-dependent methyltransferase